jgi:hypothetical protein
MTDNQITIELVVAHVSYVAVTAAERALACSAFDSNDAKVTQAQSNRNKSLEIFGADSSMLPLQKRDWYVGGHRVVGCGHL